MRFSLPLISFAVLNFTSFAATVAHAQTSLLGQTFDGYTVGTNVPAGTTQTFGTVTGVFPVSNTNASALFPNASSGSSVSGGDAGTNYATFGTVAAERARGNTIAGFAGAAFSVYYDINLPSAGTGGALLSIVNSAATDVNAGGNTFTAFTLTNTTGAVTASGTGVTLTGGTGTISLNTEVVLSLVVNATATAAAYTSAGFTTTLPAFTADLYASSTGGVATYVGRLTSTTGTNATTNIPQQIGFANFNATSPNLRINELDAVTGLSIATVPEPSTYAMSALGGFALAGWLLRRRVA